MEPGQAAELAGLLKLEELTLEIGFQLIPLVDEKQGGQLSEPCSLYCAGMCQRNLGFLMPPVHISDNLRLKPREYVFSLRGIEIGRWQTENASMLAVSADPARRPLAGKETREPAFGVPAVWIGSALEDQAIAAGYSVVDATTVVTTHLGELVRQHAWELLGRAETKRLLDSLNESHPKLLEELMPKLMTLGEVQRVLEQMLRERVSIRDLGTILEAMVETAPLSKSTVALVEAARQAIGQKVGSAPARCRRTVASSADRSVARRRDSGHSLPRDCDSIAHSSGWEWCPGAASSGRFFETTYRSHVCFGPSRAPLS